MIILLTSSHPGNQIEKNKLGDACSTFGEERWGKLRESDDFEDLRLGGE
jgi:hypothetical protein